MWERKPGARSPAFASRSANSATSSAAAGRASTGSSSFGTGWASSTLSEAGSQSATRRRSSGSSEPSGALFLAPFMAARRRSRGGRLPRCSRAGEAPGGRDHPFSDRLDELHHALCAMPIVGPFEPGFLLPGTIGHKGKETQERRRAGFVETAIAGVPFSGHVLPSPKIANGAGKRVVACLSTVGRAFHKLPDPQRISSARGRGCEAGHRTSKKFENRVKRMARGAQAFLGADRFTGPPCPR